MEMECVVSNERELFFKDKQQKDKSMITDWPRWRNY